MHSTNSFRNSSTLKNIAQFILESVTWVHSNQQVFFLFLICMNVFMLWNTQNSAILMREAPISISSKHQNDAVKWAQSTEESFSLQDLGTEVS